MITELLLSGAFTYGYSKFRDIKLFNLKKQIKDCLRENKLDYYTITDSRKDKYGCTFIISLNGRGYIKLKEAKELLETKVGYMVDIEQNLNYKTATVKIIINTLNDDTKFVPIKTKPYEIFTGIEYSFNKLIIDLRKFPHVLVSGQTGCGKTEEIRLILTNLINNFTDRDINIYFSELSNMCDYSIFENCKQIKGYAKNIEESEKLFNYLMYIYEKRLNIFKNNNVKNIQEYNDKFNDKRMNYNYLVLDEMADYYPVNKIEDNYEQKVSCYNLLKHMVRKFRKCGIFLLIGIQRPDTTVLDASLKSGLCTKIGFSQNNDASSLVVADTTELTNIENRKALLMYGNKRQWFKTLYINDKIINQYINSSVIKNRDKYTDYNKFLKKGNKELSKNTKDKNNKKVIDYKVKIKNVK